LKNKTFFFFDLRLTKFIRSLANVEINQNCIQKDYTKKVWEKKNVKVLKQVGFFLQLVEENE
jgi:hypothetical protein